MTVEQLSRRAAISVSVQGVCVVLTLGDRSLSLDYNTATDLAVLLRGTSKIAKQNAGDMSLRCIGFADLTDANLDERKIQNRSAVFTIRK